jgi:hypothetical protein
MMVNLTPGLQLFVKKNAEKKFVKKIAQKRKEKQLVL